MHRAASSLRPWPVKHRSGARGRTMAGPTQGPTEGPTEGPRWDPDSQARPWGRAADNEPMTASTIDAKAARLLKDGRVTIVRLSPRWRVLTVQGDSGAHRVIWREGHGWVCSCPATVRCSHIAAAELAVRGRLAESAVWYSPRDGWKERQAP